MHLTGLFVYPVKGCAAVALERAVVGRYGLNGDRQWMVVDTAGRFVTQRTHPLLARVRPRLVPRAGSAGTGSAGAEAASVGDSSDLLLEGAGWPSLTVRRPDRADREVAVWASTVRAADAGDDAAAWFSGVLGADVRLVAVAPGFERPVNPARDRWGREVGFADGYPLLLCTEASLHELNRLASEPVPMERFRPNLVVGGTPTPAPWAEDTWQELAVGDGARFDVVSSCSRCTVPQVDQKTGERHREPGPVLAAHRRGEDNKTYFGRNLVHVTLGTEVAVGDPVRVLA